MLQREAPAVPSRLLLPSIRTLPNQLLHHWSAHSLPRWVILSIILHKPFTMPCWHLLFNRSLRLHTLPRGGVFICGWGNILHLPNWVVNCLWL